MKIILTVLIVISFTACKQKESKQEIESLNIDTLKTENKKISLKFDETVLSDITKYYQKGYGEKFEVEVNDSSYNMTYRHTPDAEDDRDYHIISIYIPTKGKRGLIYGDLNNDNLQDLVVAVYAEGSEIGYKNSGGDIFTFINLNSKPKLINTIDIVDIGLTKSINFWPTKIENGYLVGSSYNWADSDEECCPSLKYLTKLKLSNNKLVYDSETKIK